MKESGRIHICMYHYVRDFQNCRYPNIKGMDVRSFRSQMEFFKNNFTVVRMEQVMNSLKEATALPDNAVLLTFDDGYVDNYTYVLPILEEFGFQGSFFIPAKTISQKLLLDVNKIHFLLASANTEELLKDVKLKLDYYRGQEFQYPSTEDLWNQYAVENRFDCKEIIFIKRILQTVLPEELRNRLSSELFEAYVGVKEEVLASELYMTKEQIRTLKRHGMYIGMHGYDHYWLGNLSTEKMREDISEGLSVLDEFIDRKEWVMNYPYGSYNDGVIDYIRDNGAVMGLTTNFRVANIEQDNPYCLPRLDCNDFPPISENYKRFI